MLLKEVIDPNENLKLFEENIALRIAYQSYDGISSYCGKSSAILYQ
jgi:hypothetical protein